MWAVRRAGGENERIGHGGGGAQESLCNRSFLLFPGVAAAKGELSLGEVNLDSRWVGGVDGATRTGREGRAALVSENRDGERGTEGDGEPR